MKWMMISSQELMEDKEAVVKGGEPGDGLVVVEAPATGVGVATGLVVVEAPAAHVVGAAVGLVVVEAL